MNDLSPVYHFISGAGMWPTDLHAAIPNASFVARGHIATAEASVDVYFSGAITDRVWGLVVAHPSGGRTAAEVTVTTDDGRTLAAFLGESPLLSGNPEQVLAAARYWELPPAFVSALREALESGGIAVADEEPRDDGNLGQ